MTWAQDTFGVAPAYGGEHIGLGTCNALLSLGEVYLEIIAPDPAQSLDGNLGGKFAELSSGGLVTFAVQGDLAAINAGLQSHGLTARGPNRTQRKTSDGEVLTWELLIPHPSKFGARLPFFIDWLDCPHPSTTNPPAGHFQALTISDPGASELREVFQDIGFEQDVEEGQADLAVSISTEKGTVSLTSNAQTRVLSMG